MIDTKHESNAGPIIKGKNVKNDGTFETIPSPFREVKQTIRAIFFSDSRLLVPGSTRNASIKRNQRFSTDISAITSKYLECLGLFNLGFLNYIEMLKK